MHSPVEFANVARHHISLCKITRGSKILKKKNSVTRSILDNVMRNEEEKKI
ncbi:MAG: hypothetical protein XD77_1396 [Marinimicrobia bacterium 46_47]|nr:MAG: hypothetical protein XD77_1396 [Marinimicrobia bacterium 46_47]